MDADIKSQLLPIIENTKEGLAAAVEVLKEQAPLLVKELLWWEGVQSGLYCAVGIAGFLVLFFLRKQIVSAMKKAWDDDTVFAVLIPVVVGAVATGSLFALNLTWLQILIAPRVFLLEYVAKWV